jgi:hypothetical protein
MMTQSNPSTFLFFLLERCNLKIICIMIYIIYSGMMQFAVHPQRNPTTKQHICIIKIFHWRTIYYLRFHHLPSNIKIYFIFVYDVGNCVENFYSNIFFYMSYSYIIMLFFKYYIIYIFILYQLYLIIESAIAF